MVGPGAREAYVEAAFAVDEFLPKLRVNPRFLADNDMVILDRREDPHGLALPSGPLPIAVDQFALAVVLKL